MYAKGMATEPDVELAAVRFVCELFARNRHLSEGPVVCEAPEDTLEAIRRQGIPAQGRDLDDVVAEMEHDVIGYGYNADHARFLGFVPGPTSAISWLGDVIAAGYNRHAGSFANYPAGLAAEDTLLAWCAAKAGFPADTAGGLFVSGGSMANLTALAAARDAVKEKLEARQEIVRSLAVFGGDEGERTRRADILRFQIDEIRAADVKDGEEEELLARRDKIRHSERILEGLETASRSLTADGSGTDAVRTARRALSSLVRYDASLAPLAERLDAAAAELDDIAETVDGLGSSYEFDEREAERVESRLDEIAALKRKYGASAADIRAFLQRAEAEYELLSGSSEKYAALTKELERADDALFSACEALTAVRKKAAERFSQRVAAELKTLNIPSAKFEISFRGYRRDEVGHADREGLDKVTFLFSANAGEPLKELGKIISGGEMSRFMLAIKAQISAEHEIGTYLFDEIDAGISGKTARVVAEKFCKIAKDTQIIAVSHLAQIAAAADREFLIEKTQTGNKTYTCIRPVEGTARIGEIARLLGGEETSELAFRHAEELLDNAAAYKKTLSQQ